MGKDRFDFSEIDAALPVAERMQEEDRTSVPTVVFWYMAQTVLFLAMAFAENCAVNAHFLHDAVL